MDRTGGNTRQSEGVSISNSLTSGCMPNVYYGTVHARTLSMADIRRHESFFGLPPPEMVFVKGKSSYRYVREEDDLWKRLHKGTLTTSLLNSVLGLYEPSAAKVLGIGKGWVSHGRVLSAYRHLCDQPYVPEHLACIDEGKALAHNRKVHEAFRTSEQRMKSESSVSAIKDENLVDCEEMKLKKSRQLKGMDINGVRCAWGKAQEPATLADLCDVFPESVVVEVGLVALEEKYLEERWGFQPGSLPPLASTPDGILLEKGHGDDVAVISELFQNLEGGCEVVEAKNTCPFVSSTNRRKAKYVFMDSGPRDQCHVQYVPQLQFHMLCTGLSSAVLVSRSASKGMRVFRMHKDEEYIHMMLQIISIFWKEMVIPRILPAKNVFRNLRIHQQLLLRTRELARQAEMVYDGSHSKSLKCLVNADCRFFLD
eukprot:jgi/Picsp_1/4357/NSC_01863-R1_protein